MDGVGFSPSVQVLNSLATGVNQAGSASDKPGAHDSAENVGQAELGGSESVSAPAGKGMGTYVDKKV